MPTFRKKIGFFGSWGFGVLKRVAVRKSCSGARAGVCLLCCKPRILLQAEVLLL